MGPSRIPVPNLQEDNLQYSYKTYTKRTVKRPPKLKHRCNTSLSKQNTSVAFSISFRHDGNSEASFTPLEHDVSFGADNYFEKHFTQLGKLGEGSFGEVFKVQSKEDGHLYAIKMSKEDSFRNRQDRLEEVRRYEQFSGQENFVQFYRAWEQDSKLFMQMELCRESLEQYLVRCRNIPENKIWSILLDLSLGLKSLHDRNLIHLDIKLENILVTDDDSCKLADFGLVTDVDLANQRDTTEGDSRYMAPELLNGKFSKAADIFSLGIAMLELACNLELPSNGPLWQGLRTGKLPENFVKHLSQELIALLSQMMAPDYSIRPTVDQLLAHRKLRSIRKRRNRWRVVKKWKSKICRSRQLAWSKLCNMRVALKQIFKNLVSALGINEMKSICYNNNGMSQQQINNNTKDADILIIKDIKDSNTTTSSNVACSTPTKGWNNTVKSSLASIFAFDDNWLNSSQNATPPRFEGVNIFKSTPLNHNCRSRKDLKISFISDRDNETDNDISRIIEAHADDFLGEKRDCFTDKKHESLSLQGKKLFLALDD